MHAPATSPPPYQAALQEQPQRLLTGAVALSTTRVTFIDALFLECALTLRSPEAGVARAQTLMRRKRGEAPGRRGERGDEPR